jgi:hypothetical protein
MKATLWTDGTVNTSLRQDLYENGERMFGLFGLKQSWMITYWWSVHGGIYRSPTLAKSQNNQFNVNVLPASGDTQSFTAVSLGNSYAEKKWNCWCNLLEVRTSDMDSKWGVVSAYGGEPPEGW